MIGGAAACARGMVMKRQIQAGSELSQEKKSNRQQENEQVIKAMARDEGRKKKRGESKEEKKKKDYLQRAPPPACPSRQKPSPRPPMLALCSCSACPISTVGDSGGEWRMAWPIFSIFLNYYSAQPRETCPRASVEHISGGPPRHLHHAVLLFGCDGIEKSVKWVFFLRNRILS